MVRDQGQVVAVVVAPADLVGPDIHESVQAGRVQAVGDHPLTDTPDGVPVTRDRRVMVVLSVLVAKYATRSSKSRVNPERDRDGLDLHPMLRARQAPPAGSNEHLPTPEVQMSPS